MFDLTRTDDSYDSEDDEDYVPSAAESDGGISEGEDGAESDVEAGVAKKTKKGKRQAAASRKRRDGMKLDEEMGVGEASPEDKVAEETNELAETKKADLLWADFLKDVEPPPKMRSAQASPTTSNPKPAATPVAATPGEKKVKITKVMNFAGETVLVDKEVDADSKEAKSYAGGSTSPPGAQPLLPGTKRPAGIKNVLGQLLNKKQKLSVLDKSKLDWEKYKKEQGIEEEIQTHNRGKDGYLEKQAFLQRADLRQFEIEKNLRAKTRVNRIV